MGLVEVCQKSEGRDGVGVRGKDAKGKVGSKRQVVLCYMYIYKPQAT